MTSLMKLDLWLLRWALPFIVLFAPIVGVFFYTDSPMNGLLLVFIMGLTLVQMDEKQRTRRFMLSLPIPLKRFLQARALVVISIGVIWITLENVGRVIGDNDVTLGNIFIQTITQFAPMIVLAPVVLALLTLINHPPLKWGLTFFVYIVTIVIGKMFGFFITGLTYLGALAYIFSVVYLFLAIVICWLILLFANNVRVQNDLV